MVCTKHHGCLCYNLYLLSFFVPYGFLLSSLYILVVLLDSFRNRTSGDLVKEVRNMRLRVKDFLFKQKVLAKELEKHRDLDAKTKAELKVLKGNFWTFCMIYHLLL